MAKQVGLGAIVRYEGKLMEVYAIGEGKTVHLRQVDGSDVRCPGCGQWVGEASLLEHSKLFQEGVESVETVSEGAGSVVKVEGSWGN